MISEDVTRLNNHGFYTRGVAIEFSHVHNDRLRIFVNCFDEWVFNPGWSATVTPTVSKNLDDVIQAYFNYRGTK